jgi:hypothetical protein
LVLERFHSSIRELNFRSDAVVSFGAIDMENNFFLISARVFEGGNFQLSTDNFRMGYIAPAKGFILSQIVSLSFKIAASIDTSFLDTD